MRPPFATFTAFAAAALLAAAPAAADYGGVDPGTPKPGQNGGWATASDGGISIKARVNAYNGMKHVVTGAAGTGRKLVVLERQVSASKWTALAYVNTAANGSYTAKWKVGVFGKAVLRVRAQGMTGAPTATVVAYHVAKATIFGGPGEYPQPLAGGGTLGKTTLGLAHLTLPFNTKVQIAYGAKSILLPVIDRGPYRKGYSFDVTYTAAAYLGMDGLATIGYVIAGRDPGI